MSLIEIINYKSNQYLNLNKSLLSLPGYVFWKDINGYFLGCNDLFCELTKVLSNQDIQGKTDLDFSWNMYQPSIRNDDQQVQKLQKTCCFIEAIRLSNNDIQNLLTVKAPLMAMDGSIAGVIAACIPLEEKGFHDSLKKFFNFSEKFNLNLEPRLMSRIIAKIVQLNENQGYKASHFFDYEAVVFSLREAQCLHYFFNHYSAQKTSEQLFISKKTVEFHLANIKEKLNCYDTSRITEIAVNLGFIDLMFMTF